jgi:uroporphyrinogen decarboxylase
MNSRERVLKVLNHEIPDRVPVDLGSTRTSGISAIAYNKLTSKLGLNNSLPKMYDVVQQLVYPDPKIREIFNIDIIDAGQAFINCESSWNEFLLRDNSKCLVPGRIDFSKENDGTINVVYRDGTILGSMPPKSLYIDQTYWVYGDLEKIPDVLSGEDFAKELWTYATPSPGNINIFDDLQAKLFKECMEKIYKETDYAIMLRFGGNLVESGFGLRGMENYLCDLYMDEKGVNRFLDFLMEGYMESIKKILDLAGEHINILMFADDMGSENAAFFSPEIYKKYFKKRHTQMWELIHDKSKCKIFLHSCGSIYELIPDLIDAGLDILNPIQTSARNMEPDRLKNEFGRDLIFWGGCCDTREVLVNGTPEDVKADVRKRIKILGQNGGLIFNQIHNILADVPPENIKALFDAAHLYGQY